MQRNILKITLACCVTLFLAAAPGNSLHAAENTTEAATETVVDAASRSTDASGTRGTYYVNAQRGLNMRSAPSKNSDVIKLLPYGTEVTVIETSDDGWYKIEYSNESGYVSASYVTKASKTDTGADNDDAEADESVPSTETALENIQSTLGITPVIIALIAAIIIMIILAIFTAYSFLKRDKGNYDEEMDDDYDYDYPYDEDDHIEYDDNSYDENYEEYMEDDEEYDEEYYDDEE